MAVSGEISLSRAMNSSSYAYSLWYNAQYCGNTMNVDDKTLGKITSRWESLLPQWNDKALSEDKNVYKIEVSDDDFSNWQKNGRQKTQKSLGDSNKTGQALNTMGTVAGAGAGIGFGIASNLSTMKVAGGNFLKAGKTAVTGKGFEKAMDVSRDKIGEGATIKKSNAAKTSAYVAAVLAIAVAAKYWATNPNRKQTNMLNTALQENLVQARSDIDDANNIIEDTNDEVNDMSDEAREINEDSQEEIDEMKAEFDMYQKTYNELISKLQSGEPLNEDEKSLMSDIVALLEELGLNIQEVQEEAQDSTSVLFEEMDAKQADFDEAVVNMAEAEGTTAELESFDEQTRFMCYAEAIGQGLNAASGAMAGIKLLAGPFWNWVLGAAALVAAGSSGLAATEQYQNVTIVQAEIDMRRDVQGFNGSIRANYDERIATYDDNLGIVGDLEIEMPDEIKVDDLIDPSKDGGGDPSAPIRQPVVTSTNAPTQTPGDQDDKNKKK